MDRQIYDRMRLIEAEHWWFAARRQIIDRQLRTLPLGPSPRLLEVGCGTGGNLAMLQKYGQLRAVEPDSEARAHASMHGVEVAAGLLPDALPSYDAPFDLVAAFDVIEHIDADAASVAAMAGLLRPGGYVIATAPAYAWLWSSHDEVHHHKRRYGRQAFATLFTAAGLRVRRATYFNTFLLSAIGAVRLSRRLTRAEGGDDEAMPSPRVNAILKAIFASEAAVLRRMNLPFGASILVIAEKPI
jgi:SAM-dependent methyltransferase